MYFYLKHISLWPVSHIFLFSWREMEWLQVQETGERGEHRSAAEKQNRLKKEKVFFLLKMLRCVEERALREPVHSTSQPMAVVHGGEQDWRSPILLRNLCSRRCPEIKSRDTQTVLEDTRLKLGRTSFSGCHCRSPESLLMTVSLLRLFFPFLITFHFIYWNISYTYMVQRSNW